MYKKRTSGERQKGHQIKILGKTVNYTFRFPCKPCKRLRSCIWEISYITLLQWRDDIYWKKVILKTQREDMDMSDRMSFFEGVVHGCTCCTDRSHLSILL